MYITCWLLPSASYFSFLTTVSMACVIWTLCGVLNRYSPTPVELRLRGGREGGGERGRERERERGREREREGGRERGRERGGWETARVCLHTRYSQLPFMVISMATLPTAR